MEKDIRRLFFDINEPSAYSSASQINKHLGVGEERIRRVLAREYPYSINKQRRYRFARLKTIPTGFFTDTQCDLADFQALARWNKGARYCLLLVDIMSRQIFAVPVKRKNTAEMIRAFDVLLRKLPKQPTTIFSDKGNIANKALKKTQF